MKNYLKTALFSTVLAFGAVSPAFADQHEGHKSKCDCTKECAEKCKKGEGKDCKCEHCDCKKSGDCGESCAKKDHSKHNN